MNILIWRQIVTGSDIDIFSKTDYSKLDQRIKELYNGSCPNWGNKLWFGGIYSIISTPENTVTFRTKETAEEINVKYDLIIYPMANFFSIQFGMNADQLALTFKSIRIPVYIIACGIQTDSSLGIDGLIDKIGRQSAVFIDTIYNTGGEFALRGFYTKEFFDKLGFKDAIVTGCPSLYQLGRDFKVSTNKADQKDISPVFNGNLRLIESAMKVYPSSVYIAQDMYADCLYKRGYLDRQSLKGDILFTYYYSTYQARLLGDGRIKMFVDLPAWYSFLHSSDYNFALGTKLHGTVMSILAGIPAVLLSVDYRTQEVADFFHIPSAIEKKTVSQRRLSELYNSMDYSTFNKVYPEKFDRFEQFLRKHRIVNRINSKNKVLFSESKDLCNAEILPSNQREFKKYYKKLILEKPFMLMGHKLIHLKNSSKN